MGRELRRKEAKRSGKNVKEVQKLNKKKTITKRELVIIIVAIILLFVLTYLFTGIFATKDIKWFSKNNKDEETTNSIKNRILANDSLKQMDDEYYVYYYDSTKEDSEITTVVDDLDGTVYRADLHDDFNSNFVGEPSGIVDTIDNLKVSDPTVIKVSSEKIIAFYSGEEIKTLLK